MDLVFHHDEDCCFSIRPSRGKDVVVETFLGASIAPTSGSRRLLMGLRIACVPEVCGAFGWLVLGEDFGAGV